MRKCILLQKCKPTSAHLHSQYHHLPFHTTARHHVSKITNINFTANQRELINFGSEINIITILSTKHMLPQYNCCYNIIQYMIILLQDKAAMNTMPSQLCNMYSVSVPMFMDHQLLYYPHSLSLSLSLSLSSFFSLSATHICFREGLEQLMCGTLYPTRSMTCLVFIICILIFTSPSFLLRIQFH